MARLPSLEDINFRLRNPPGIAEDIDTLIACEILTQNADGSLDGHALAGPPNCHV